MANETDDSVDVDVDVDEEEPTTPPQHPIAFIFKIIRYTILLLVSVYIGWCSEGTPMWEGKFYASMIPVMNGYFPPLMVGHGKMNGSTPEVPSDMVPLPRPYGELFLPLNAGGGTNTNSNVDNGNTCDSDDDSGTCDNNNATAVATAATANLGNLMPQNGIGMCCRPSAYDDVLVERTVLWYLLLGGRHIDTAALYLNHKPIGRAIQVAMKRGIPRSEIWITTKLWPSQFGYKTTMSTVVKEWLKELQVDYLDLVLLHAPVRVPRIPVLMAHLSDECLRSKATKTECHKQTWTALSELRSDGIVRNVGVSNFVYESDDENVELEKDGSLASLVALHEEVDGEKYAPVANNQIQFNPWMTEEWIKTVEYCKEHGIQITGYNTLGGSFQQHETEAIDVLTQLANKYSNGRVAQIMLRWALQKGVAIIPGTGNPNHMKDNLHVYDAFVLTDDDMAAIDSLRKTDEVKKFFSLSAGFFT